MIRTYEDALAYLKSREKFGIKFGLSNIDQLAAALGRPERRFPSVLIAGTNGKGSTAALCQSILTAAGYRTGRYTSPHIRFLEERIQVDGRPIAPDELASVVARVADAAQTLTEPTFFEAITASAFAFFADCDVDAAVLEVGMGGRWDATNIAPASVSVITPIGFDHERFLGDSIAAIASEKAAIIKEGRPVVIGELAPEALGVVRDEARLKNADLIRARDGSEIQVVELLLIDPVHPVQRVRLTTPECDYGNVDLPLLGEHQLDNLVLAVRVAELLEPELTAEQVREGVRSTQWLGRLQQVEGTPALLLDAAHNVMAAEQLGRFLKAHPRENRVLLFGVMKDKRVYEMLEQLLPHVSHFVATRPEMSRARGPEPLASFARDRGTPAEAIASSERALARARELAGPTGEVVVAGSIFLLGEVVVALEGALIAAGEAHTAAQTPA
ncbi:MAG: folylpolyglutamate synthase/dihydrofolate synthase family protein [Acidobacteriota bacterium]|nr:MAG: folylpolyglutamate synthase/dihydrofolate synthase family protein [Acidobacteriota bacterium]